MGEARVNSRFQFGICALSTELLLIIQVLRCRFCLEQAQVMAEFLPADHWKDDVSSRKHTRPAPKKDASWDFLQGAGPSAPQVAPGSARVVELASLSAIGHLSLNHLVSACSGRADNDLQSGIQARLAGNQTRE